MKIDITLPITNEMARDANDHLKLAGHVGTHFDVVNYPPPPAQA